MDWTSEMVAEPGVPGTDTEQPAEAESACQPPAPRCPSLLLNDIRLLAYRKWDGAGRPSGNSFRFWLEAEEELRQQQQALANGKRGVEPH